MVPWGNMNTGYWLGTPSVGGAIGGWKELGRTTLGGSSTEIEVNGFANKRYYQILTFLDPAATHNTVHRVGNGSFDTGNNYAYRNSFNGAADATATSQNFATWLFNSAQPSFSVGYYSNLSTKEKLSIIFNAERNSSGAGNAPQRREHVTKWANTSNPIDRFKVFPFSGSPNLNSGSEVVVLGWDPTDIHTDNFWEELASVNASGSSTNLSSGTITAKKYLWVQSWLKNSTSHVTQMIFNNDTTTYSHRQSLNGAADTTSTSQANIDLYPAVTTPIFVNMFILNISANEKLVIGHTVNQNTSGVGNPPNRNKFVGKHDNTSSQITEIDIDSSSGNWDSSSIIKVWGHD